MNPGDQIEESRCIRVAVFAVGQWEYSAAVVHSVHTVEYSHTLDCTCCSTVHESSGFV